MLFFLNYTPIITYDNMFNELFYRVQEYGPCFKIIKNGSNVQVCTIQF